MMTNAFLKNKCPTFSDKLKQNFQFAEQQSEPFSESGDSIQFNPT